MFQELPRFQEHSRRKAAGSDCPVRNSVRFQDSEHSRSGAVCNRSEVRSSVGHLFFPVLPVHIHSGSVVRRL